MKEMKMTLNLKITYETNTDKPFYMVTPSCGTYQDSIICYPIFIGNLNEVAKFVAQLSNVNYAIAIVDDKKRTEMSRTIDEMRTR